MTTQNTYDLSRFIAAHEQSYALALSEIRRGRKDSHWIWYIFPQLKGLGRSATSAYYGIQDIAGARAFLAEPILGAHLIEISKALLDLETDDILTVMDRPDDKKLKSSMTLFDAVSEGEDVFQRVLDKFFRGEKDKRTLRMLGLM